ncbi:target of Nesh-SH3 isoform X26 [Pseudophryne corroboree]|uniref:target of Nesh-SH3 isoform X26 n=1 Tax=Pseudophryne corroboree TaxID=495146 RepID=UPI003081BE63
MISLLSFLLLCGIISAHLGDAQKLPKVKKLNMKVHFNITGDTLVMKFHRPNENIKLEGFILGYGSNYFTNQYIQWPENGKSFITDVESETRYLIAVKPNENHKKTCKAEKNSVQKPLQVVIGSLTPTSVFLSWGILINPQVDWSALNKCPNDRFYTVRYREKNKDWHFQLCPTTETVIDNLKPNTFYEFGVKDNSDDGIWSKSQNHKTNTKGKENGNIENTYKIPKGTLQYASEDTKTLIPVYVVKQGFQNITKSTTAPLPTERSPVPRVETKKPHFRTTTRASTPKPKPVSKVTASTPVTKPAGKPVPEEPKAVTHPFIQVNNKPTEPSVIYGQSTPLASPTIVPVPFTYESPTEQPETVLAIERLATYVPEAMTIQQSLYAGMYPTSTDVPDVSSSKFLIRQRSTMAGIQQMPTDVSQLSTDLPLQIHRTAPGVQSISTFMSKGNIQLPLKTRRTTLAANEKQSIYVPTTVSSLGELQAHYATTSQNIPAKQSVLPSQTHAQTTTAFTGGPHITTKHKSIEVPPSPPVPKETASFHPKPFPSTEAPLMESDSTEPDSEMHTNEASHTHQPEKMTLASDDKTVLKFTSTSKPKTTAAPYRLQDTSSKPKSSLRPRTRPAQNGTTQGLIRARPTGEFNWVPGTIPGAKIYDNTKLLGSSRNISMTPDNTGKNKFSVSATPLPPVRPTSMRRRVQTGNVTGRPGVAVSAPPFSPVRPTSIHRRPQPTKVTGRPGSAGDILIPRAPSTARPSLTSISIKTPRKQPTLPAPEDDLEDPTVFSPSPKSDIDALGKKRFEAPHVLYMGKNETVPCSITESLKHFPTEESTNQEILNAPQNPPSNLTVVTVEGCSSFVILDWDQSDNDTVTEYKVISKENGGPPGKDQSILITNQTHSTVENLKPNTSYEFQVIPQNPLGEGPVSATVEFSTESADPRVSEPVSGGKDAIWTQIKFKSDSYSECKGKQYVKRTWYKKFVGIQLCNSLRYKIYLSDTLSGTFYNIGDQSGFGEDHCQFVDSFLDGRTGQQLLPEYLASRKGFYRSVRQQPVDFGQIGGHSHIGYVHWYECGIAIPGKW